MAESLSWTKKWKLRFYWHIKWRNDKMTFTPASGTSCPTLAFVRRWNSDSAKYSKVWSETHIFQHFPCVGVCWGVKLPPPPPKWLQQKTEKDWKSQFGFKLIFSFQRRSFWLFFLVAGGFSDLINSYSVYANPPTMATVAKCCIL